MTLCNVRARRESIPASALKNEKWRGGESAHPIHGTAQRSRELRRLFRQIGTWVDDTEIVIIVKHSSITALPVDVVTDGTSTSQTNVSGA